MKKFLYSIISIWFCIGSTLLSQNPEWITYNTSNSGLPTNTVLSLAIDGSSNKWIGTIEGLAKFDGTNWTVYNESSSGLPGNIIECLAIDGSGNKWIGGGGLAKFDDTNWNVYNTSNSGLPNNWVLSLAIDGSGNKWIGAYYGGLAKFDGTTWTVFDTSNSGLPDNQITCLAIDGGGNKWIGTGVWTFDWSCGGGMAVYNEGGIVSVEENPTLSEIIPNEYLLSQNYPNPFNPSTTIKYSIPKLSFVSIKIYDVLGSEVATLLNEEKPVGTYELSWNAANLSSGVYFYRLQAGSFVQTRKMILLK